MYSCIHIYIYVCVGRKKLKTGNAHRNISQIILKRMVKALSSARLVTPVVVPHTDIAVHDAQEPGNDGRNDDNGKARRVTRRVLLLEEERADEVAEAVADVEARGGDGPLGVAGRVGDLQTHEGDEAASQTGHDVRAKEESGALAQREDPEEHGAERDDELAEDDEPGPEVGHLHGHVAGEEHVAAAPGAGRDEQEERLEVAELEALDDDGHKGRDGGVGDHAEERDGEGEPELDVHGQLEHLLHLVVLVADARVVGAQTSDEDVALARLIALGSDGIRLQDEEQEDAPCGGQASGEVEHEAPRRAVGVCRSEAVVDEGGDDGDVAVEAKPDAGEGVSMYCTFEFLSEMTGSSSLFV